MNWISRLERKYGRFCIPNLISVIVGGQILVYAIELFVNQFISVYLGLSRSLLLMGQVWRLITFVFIRFGGRAAERHPRHLLHMVHRHGAGKGVGRFPLQPLLPAGDDRHRAGLSRHRHPRRHLLPVAVAAAAFAMLYPEVQVLLFFVIPVRVKYFGLFAAAMWLFSFLTAGWLYKVSYLLSMLGFVLFFGPQALRSVRAWIRREQWKRKNRR